MSSSVTVTKTRSMAIGGLRELLPIAGYKSLLMSLAFSEHTNSHRKVDSYFYLILNQSIYVLVESKPDPFLGDSYEPLTNIQEKGRLVLIPAELRRFLDCSVASKEKIDSDKYSTAAMPANAAEPITTLQAIGIMAELLAAENGYTYRRGENVNAKAIGIAVANRAKARFGDDIRGFESFNKKISEGLKTLERLKKK